MQKITVMRTKIFLRKYLLYQGRANFVDARSIDGRLVRFPAKILKPYITKEGIRGIFVIYFNDDGKFQSIQELTSS